MVIAAFHCTVVVIVAVVFVEVVIGSGNCGISLHSSGFYGRLRIVAD